MKIAAALMLTVLAIPARAECLLCSAKSAAHATEPDRPLTISVETALDLGRAAQGRGGGSIAVDQGGARHVSGLIDLGGFAVTGHVRLSGQPFAHVRVSLPATTMLTAPDGSQAQVVDVRADAPPDIVLGADGSFDFGFGGRLNVPAGTAGDFHGRIAITADYE